MRPVQRSTVGVMGCLTMGYTRSWDWKTSHSDSRSGPRWAFNRRAHGKPWSVINWRVISIIHGYHEPEGD